jgi:hypothetical protein
MAATEAAAPATEAVARKLLLRLDDGSLIGRAADLGIETGSHTVIRITVEQAAELGRVSDKEVARLQGILARFRAQHAALLTAHATVRASACAGGAAGHVTWCGVAHAAWPRGLRPGRRRLCWPRQARSHAWTPRLPIWLQLRVRWRARRHRQTALTPRMQPQIAVQHASSLVLA